MYFINKDLLAVLTPLECHALNKQTNPGVHARIFSMSVQATRGACREVNACVNATMLCRSKVPRTAQTCTHHRGMTPQASRKHARHHQGCPLQMGYWKPCGSKPISAAPAAKSSYMFSKGVRSRRNQEEICKEGLLQWRWNKRQRMIDFGNSFGVRRTRKVFR